MIFQAGKGLGIQREIKLSLHEVYVSPLGVQRNASRSRAIPNLVEDLKKKNQANLWEFCRNAGPISLNVFSARFKMFLLLCKLFAMAINHPKLGADPRKGKTCSLFPA